MADVDLIREAIQLSGLSSRAFAEDIAWRDERTVRRWINGDQELPERVRAKLAWFAALPVPRRSAYVQAATARIDAT